MKAIKLLLFFIVFLSVISVGQALTNVTACTNLTTDNEVYELNTSLTGVFSGESWCLKITGDNITLDGKGFTVTDTGEGNTSLFITGVNSTVQDLNLYNYTNGIYITPGGDIYTTLDNLTVYGKNSSTGYGLKISSGVDTRQVLLNASEIYSFSNCIQCGTQSSYNNFTSNTLRNCSDAYNSVGVGIEGWYNILDDNDIYWNGQGIVLENTDNVTIKNNRIYNNSENIRLQGNNHIVFSNNISNPTGAYSFYLGSGSGSFANLNISNNILWGSPSTSHMYTYSGNPGHIYFRYNTFQNSTSTIFLGTATKNWDIDFNNFYNVVDVIDDQTTNINFTGNTITNSSGTVYDVYYGGGTNATDILIWNNTINNATYAIQLSSSSTACNISNNNITQGTYGIGYGSGSLGANYIYNNYLNNTYNTFGTTAYADYWNITKTAGTNIANGPFIGGNYFSDYTGSDTDSDGIGNTPYNVTSTLNDSLPLMLVVSPSYTSATTNETWTNVSTGFNVLWTSNNAISHFVLSVNYNGTWINNSLTASTGNWSNDTFDIPIAGTFSYKYYVNDSDNDWTATTFTWTEHQTSNITNCTTILDAGVYTIYQNLTGNFPGETWCINASVDDITINGTGQWFVDGDDAIIANSIDNLTIHSTKYDNRTNQLDLTDVNASIYNNRFTYGHDISLSGTNTITWNTTKTAGTNIVGQSFLGGNFWGDNRTFDEDGDYLGEDNYTLATGQTDLLPLVETILGGDLYWNPQTYNAVFNTSENDTFDIQLQVNGTANMFHNLDFNYTGDLANTSIFSKVWFTEDPTNITDTISTITVTLQPCTVCAPASGTYSGNITINDTRINKQVVVEVNATLTNDGFAVLNMTPTSKTVSKTSTTEATTEFTLQNVGNYKGSNCNATVSSTLSSFTLVSPNNFDIAANSNKTITLTFGTGSAGSYVGSLDVICMAEENGTGTATESSSILLSVTTGTNPGTGGGTKTLIINEGTAYQIEVTPGIIERLLFYTGSLTDDDKYVETSIQIVKPSGVEISVSARNGQDGNIEDYISAIDISDSGDLAIIKTVIPHKQTPKLISGKIVVESTGDAVEIPFNHRIINLGATIDVEEPIDIDLNFASPLFVENNEEGKISGFRIWWIITAAFLVGAAYISRKFKNKLIPILLLLGASALTFVWIIYS